MGRLTLNVLLSFAQFEREVTGERIRDKFSASRKKGMFMGGIVPLGYKLGNRRLIVDPVEAETVRLIFSQYLEIRSLPKLTGRLAELGIVSRVRVLHGKTIGGFPFRTGALSHLLANRTYIGEVRHHKQHYPGQHEPIVEKSIFDAVQTELALRLNRKRTGTRPLKAILGGLLFDSNGNRMVATHANKSGVRYCYYHSWVLAHGRKDEAGVVSRVSAYEIEVVVREALRSIVPKPLSAETGQIELGKFDELVDRIDVLADELKITLKPEPINSDEQLDCNAGESLVLSVPWSKSPVRRRKELLSNESNNYTRRSMRTETRARLLKGVAQGRIWLNQLVSNQTFNTDHIATEQSLSERSVRSTIPLAFLAPDIVEAAINGELPRGITVSQMTDLPWDWQDQRRTLGLISVSNKPVSRSFEPVSSIRLADFRKLPTTS
ncbi:MAG: recombinase family protein [Pseudomonadota bacterium]|nr:recombinase family protein [Pseudomonadota bacterium]